MTPFRHRNRNRNRRHRRRAAAADGLLLARTAERLYWGARYVERAEDTARIVRAYNDLVVDYPSEELLRWEPLAALTGSDLTIEIPDERPVGGDDGAAASDLRPVEHARASSAASPRRVRTCAPLAR